MVRFRKRSRFGLSGSCMCRSHGSCSRCFASHIITRRDLDSSESTACRLSSRNRKGTSCICVQMLRPRVGVGGVPKPVNISSGLGRPQGPPGGVGGRYWGLLPPRPGTAPDGMDRQEWGNRSLLQQLYAFWRKTQIRFSKVLWKVSLGVKLCFTLQTVCITSLSTASKVWRCSGASSPDFSVRSETLKQVSGIPVHHEQYRYADEICCQNVSSPVRWM